MEVVKNVKNFDYSIMGIDFETANTLYNLLHSHILEYQRDNSDAPDGLVEIRDKLGVKLEEVDIIYTNIEKINNILKEQGELQNSIFTPDSTIEELGLDDLDTAFIVMALEDVFDINIPGQNLNTFKTVKDIYEFIEGRTKE